MARAVRKCKICGKEYEACKTPNPSGSFRWREVACSPEHGQEYLIKIENSRKPKAEPKRAKRKASEVVTEEVVVQPVLETQEQESVEEEDIF